MTLKTFYILWIQFVFTVFTYSVTAQTNKPIVLSLEEYTDKVQAIWSGQMIAALLGFQFEHKVSSVEWVDQLSLKDNAIPVDDDWYYEMVALRAFEKYGIDMSLENLGKQWVENSAGTWGSSREALIMLRKGIPATKVGHPRYNKMWFTIGPQFSADIYGALAPGMPNLAANLASKYGHINGYAEAVDGAVFIAGMVSIGFANNNTKEIVQQAATLISPLSPYRKCLDLVINLANSGKSFEEVVNAVEDRWHIEYPATNNAVANGGIVAACVWFGESNFLKTINLAFQAADFTDADCNAANAASVIGAVHGLKGIPKTLLDALGDSIKGDKMGGQTLSPPVNESLKLLSKRTVEVGKKFLIKNNATLKNGKFTIPATTPSTLPAELFQLSDLTKYWNPDWQLKRAGFGGANGGMPGIRGITFLSDSVLATYPRDEVRGVELNRTIKIDNEKEFSLEVAADSGRTWRLDIYFGNNHLARKFVTGNRPILKWTKYSFNLSSYKGKTLYIRLFQKVLIPGKESGNAYWKNLTIN